MGKKMLRSVLAVAFSAGLAFGAFGASEQIRDDTPHQAAQAWSKAAKPGDVVWDSAPTGQAGARQATAHPTDRAWDFAPTEKDRA